MRDGVQIKLRHRANIMLKICELVEGFLPEDEKAMPAVITVKVNDIYLALKPCHGSAAGRKLARRLMITAYRTARG